MAKKIKEHEGEFTKFITEPPTSVAIVAFSLLSLMFALFDFTEALR